MWDGEREFLYGCVYVLRDNVKEGVCSSRVTLKKERKDGCECECECVFV